MRVWCETNWLRLGYAGVGSSERGECSGSLHTAKNFVANERIVTLMVLFTVSFEISQGTPIWCLLIN
jgi:hypothetical protein